MMWSSSKLHITQIRNDRKQRTSSEANSDDFLVTLSNSSLLRVYSSSDSLGLMSRAAKATLLASMVFAGAAVWGVHAQQKKEQDVSGSSLSPAPLTHLNRQTMYQGVVRDEARQAAKRKQREQEFQESQRKRELYERVQAVGSSTSVPSS